MTVKRILKDNGLAIVMFGAFAAMIVGMSVVGWQAENNDRQDHQQTAQGYGQYITGGAFSEAVFENWESEFLQMWALVILTIFLKQRGSTDSKPIQGKMPQDKKSKTSVMHANSWRRRLRAVGHELYAHSLGLALLALFIASFVFHAIHGADAYNEMARLHGGETLSTMEYVGSSQFWFESLQNWQSEFLAVGCLLVFSIYLRERGSQQSKPVGAAYNDMTG